MAALAEAFSFTELIAVLAVSEDKDVPAILDELEPVRHELVVDDQLLAAVDARRRAGRAGRGGLRPGPGPVAERLDDAIEIGVALADEADAEGDGASGWAGGADHRLGDHGRRRPAAARGSAPAERRGSDA